MTGCIILCPVFQGILKIGLREANDHEKYSVKKSKWLNVEEETLGGTNNQQGVGPHRKTNNKAITQQEQYE